MPSIHGGSTPSAALVTDSARLRPLSGIDTAQDTRSPSLHRAVTHRSSLNTSLSLRGATLDPKGKLRREMKKPLIASILALSTLLAACGGAVPATGTSTTGGTAAACAVPVK